MEAVAFCNWKVPTFATKSSPGKELFWTLLIIDLFAPTKKSHVTYSVKNLKVLLIMIVKYNKEFSRSKKNVVDLRGGLCL